jgi:hypothetical protein
MTTNPTLRVFGAVLFAAPFALADDNTGTGGTITNTDANGLNPVASPSCAGGHLVHTFTGSGTLMVPVGVSADYLIVGGGVGGEHSFGSGWPGTGVIGPSGRGGRCTTLGGAGGTGLPAVVVRKGGGKDDRGGG